MIRKPDPKKEEQERLQNILLEMLKEEENKYCADCNAKTPRWAAWNLGVFICIRCAGIHRNLGVHISKVRSVTLDSWTAEQVQSMRVMANEKARKVYEHSLPEHFRRSLPDHQMEQFIRAKYDQKRYMLQGFTYPRIDISDLPKPGQSATKRTPVPIVRPPGAPSVSAAAAVTAPGASVNDLLDFSAPPAAAPAKTNGAASLFDADLAGLSISEPAAATSAASADLDDMFGSFVSAETPSPAAAPVGAAPAVDLGFGADLVGLSMTTTNGNGVPAGGSALDDKRSTADIMSLFGSAPAPATQIVAPGGFAAFGIQAHAPVTKTPSIDNSNGLGALAGLNFGMAPAAAPAPMAPQGMMAPMGGGMQGMGGAFPNPFGAPSAAPLPLFTQSMAPSQPSQVSPNSPSYPIPNKANAFADLSLGKVMGMMGSKPSSAPAPVAPPPAAMNFDDLLGL